MGQKYSSEHAYIYALWYKLFGRRLYKHNSVPRLDDVFEANKAARTELQRVIKKCSPRN